MRTRNRLSLVLISLACGGFAAAHPSSAPPRPLEGKWIANEEDNICGIKDLKKVSNPAKVDYDDLWDATPQIKKMKEKKIDPESTEGKALRSQARTLITKTSELVRSAKGYCGIWKAIRNEDKRVVPDATEDVKARFES